MGIPPQIPPPYPQSRAQWKAQRAQWKMQAKMQRQAYRAQYHGYSRGSLVGPLLLIAIGVIAFLMTTHRIDAARFWHWYGQWWPMILIGAGVVLAVESLAFSSFSRIRLGGGVVLMAILLAFLGMAVANKHVNWAAVGDQLTFGDVNLPRMFGSKHEAQEQIVHPLPENATLVIQNPHGDITIASGAGNDDQMHLTLDNTVYTSSDAEARRNLQATEPLITSNGNIVTVHMPVGNDRTSDMHISLPATVALEIQAGHGDVTVHDRQAAVSVNVQHGDVQLTGINGAVHAAMHQGDFSANNIQGTFNLTGHMDDVTVSNLTGATTLDGDFFGDVHLEKLQGAVHLHSSRTDIQFASLPGSLSLDGDDLTTENTVGPALISTKAKDVVLRDSKGQVRVHNENGSVDLKALDPLGEIDIQNSNGSVDLTLPADAIFSIEAAAADGEIHTDFKLAIQNNGDRSTASGQVGGGGPSIKISAEKGDITLHKR
jgi:DUF4097 and DUF4098 domain-containing protein YvlB